ncbi:hypothetical protein L1N85_19415 [Paenibacillus alkaliterrae]|uniref:hypothetical protein n=1 Tax=Paenibacillus alkaliterrae TaxID=320909 RepID=UPI001F45718C|nr:hypothetical protein [Paenibacillus alkaliterrae]MCF2940565.1 hypothetical protein [Paenibacillus alkaliterrae]
MKRLFLISDDKDFAEWIEEELSETGRFIRSLDSFDFFFPQWNAAGGADVIIFPETVIPSDENLLKIYRTVHTESPDTVFLFIYHRDEDDLTNSFLNDGNICVSYNDLDTGLLESLIRKDGAPKALSVEQQQPIPEETKISTLKNEVPEKIITTLPQEETKEATKPVLQIEPIPEPITKQRPFIKEESKIIQDLPKEPAFTPQSDKDEKLSDRTPAEQVVTAPHRTPPDESAVEVPKPRKKRSTAEQKEKLDRIKERIIIEEKIVTIHVPVHFNSMLISVVSLYPRAGATFITSNFARMLGENKVPVAVLEPVFENTGSTYYELMHGEVNAPKNWKSWAEQIKDSGSVKQDNSWSSHGVTWIPSSLDPIKGWSEEDNMKLLLSANRYPVTLCDISSRHDDAHCKKIMAMSDEIWIVADGDPIALNHHYKTIDKLKQEFESKTIRIIGNRWNRYIKNSEWKEAVLLPLLTHIPDLGTIVLKQLWAGKMAWDDTNLKNILSLPFKPMARSVVAKEMYHLIKKQYGLGAKLKSIFREIKSLDDEAKTRKY